MGAREILFRDKLHTVDEIRQMAREFDLDAIAELGMRSIPLTFVNEAEAAAWIAKMDTQHPPGLSTRYAPTVALMSAQERLAHGREHGNLFPPRGVSMTAAADRLQQTLRRRAGDQQLPDVHDEAVCVQDEVIAYIERRKAVGIERYGTVLQPHNGRDALRDLFEELVDAVQYCAQALIERDGQLP